jgi:hypothetical protein
MFKLNISDLIIFGVSIGSILLCYGLYMISLIGN